ncbi:YceI family protein [Serpens gallinarum]|uniref:YceI family protein n=1 Tax=Serpens gallinarum TaxID=2763075 RepID=A0ABR8TKN2_9PSED|nr:YceI family protein [Serpens gallinarum]MBD7976329.1 YceI family protein [Serpens gallinarum]
MHRWLSCVFFILALPAYADWQLDNDSSRVSFISTQTGNLSEVHRFLTLEGRVDDQGQVNLQIALDSVSTGIPLRDQRMRALLFDVKNYPLASIEARLSLNTIAQLAPGAQLELRLPLVVRLHGHEQTQRAELLVTRLDEKRFQVVTLAPVILHAGDFGLADGVEVLRKLANVRAISQAVPVGAVLIFVAR